MTLSYYTSPSTAGNVWRTTNLNSATPTWTSIGNSANGIPNIPVNAFAIDPANSNNLFAGTDIGVYYSSDGGANWLPFGNGLPRVSVFDMAIQPTSRTLRIATHGRGMWEIGLPAAGACSMACPANIATQNDLNQCGAVVSYPAPNTFGACGTVTCDHASGSFFPKGVTTVICKSNSGAGPESCSFTVTVNDTQPPHIGTCPLNIVKPVDPGQQTAVATFEPPGASDNCPGVTVGCSPASGTAFPVGTTTVTCTATDTSSNISSCNFTVTVLTPRAWTSAGSTGTIDEDSLNKIAVQNFTAHLIDGQTGTGTIRYNITATRGISSYCPATQSVVNVRFRNSDNTGTHAQVKFEIHRSNIVSGGNDTIFSFNSNGLGAGNAFTTASIAPNIDFDFSNFVYWIEGTLFRDDASQLADLGSIEIYESAGTLCP